MPRQEPFGPWALDTIEAMTPESAAQILRDMEGKKVVLPKEVLDALIEKSATAQAPPEIAEGPTLDEYAKEHHPDEKISAEDIAEGLADPSEPPPVLPEVVATDNTAIDPMFTVDPADLDSPGHDDAPLTFPDPTEMPSYEGLTGEEAKEVLEEPEEPKVVPDESLPDIPEIDDSIPF